MKLFAPLINSRKSHKRGKATDSFKKIIFVLVFAFLAEPAVILFSGAQKIYAEEIPRRKQQRLETSSLGSNYVARVYHVLDAQKDFGNLSEAHQTLNDLLGRIERKLSPKSKYNKKNAIKALKMIGTMLKREGHFECRENNLLIQGLEKEAAGKRYIDCDDYATIYLLAGESIGLSLKPVYAAGHMFLICSLEDNASFYWEPSVTAEKDWIFYKDWLNIADNSIYPKVLNEKEFEAVHSCNLGVAWHEKRDYSSAIKYYKNAIRQHPEFAEAYNNLGVAYAKLGNYDKALECYQKAVSMNSNYMDCLLNMGIAFHKLGCFKEAVEFYEKAIEVEPENEKAYRYAYIALVKTQDQVKAAEFINRIHDR
jgi:tetratricopeptide (TPR) repeat protein